MTEPDVSKLLSVAQAIEILDRIPVTPRVRQAHLSDSLGLVLAVDVLADRDYPPFDRSLMDGYAVRSADCAVECNSLRCIGEIAAGDAAGKVLEPGQTIAIMTGAPIPPGADSVIPVENRLSQHGDMVELAGVPAPGRFIARRGSECRAGAVVLRRGSRLTPTSIAVAATVGAAELDVFARPCAGVLATGNEIVGFDQSPLPTQIRNCNSIMLSALLSRLGCDVRDLGMARDDPKLIRDTIERGQENDVLFITGGMSMGEHDYVPRVLREIGFDLRITKLRIKPGKPFVFGVRGDRFVFGLPGNPVSGFACAARLCSRLLARMAGSQPIERRTRAKLQSPLGRNGPREFYQPAVRDDANTVSPLEWKGSADVFTLAQANCLLIRSEDEPEQPAGAIVEVLEIPG